MLAHASAAKAGPGDSLGVYAGAGSPEAVDSFERHLGRPVAAVHETFAKTSWSALADIDWFLAQWRPTGYVQRVVYSVPMLPDSGGTLAEGSTGAYNQHFRLLAQRLVAGGQGNATLRIGPEFNGSWFRWTIAVPNGAADFAAFWRQIVTTMRSVPGANFKFDWCPNGGSSYVAGHPLRAETAWPGDAYVDFVGLDIYDQSWAAHRADPAARWNEYLTRPNGLRWHRDFASAHGKPMTFPEWGIAFRRDGYGGGDSPYFVEQMHAWIRTNPVAYHMYFEYADADADYALFTGNAPDAARRFVELFGAAATGAPASASAAAASSGAAPTSTAASRSNATAGRRTRCYTRKRRIRGGRVSQRICTTVRPNVRRCSTTMPTVRGRSVRRRVCPSGAAPTKRCVTATRRARGRTIRTRSCRYVKAKARGHRTVSKRSGRAVRKT